MNSTNVYNLIILDESGSMEVIKSSTISGYNEVIETIKAIKANEPEQKHFVSLVTFNGMGIKTLIDRKAVEELQKLDENNYKPNYLTPLYDAIGSSALYLKNNIPPDQKFNVLVTIITDGEENASKEFNYNQIKTIITELKETKCWTFTYIGANHDVESTSISLSIDNHLTFTANESDVKAMFKKDADARKRYSKKLKSGKDYMTNYFVED